MAARKIDTTRFVSIVADLPAAIAAAAHEGASDALVDAEISTGSSVNAKNL